MGRPRGNGWRGGRRQGKSPVGNIVAAGLLLTLLPLFLSGTPFAEGVRHIAPIGWALLALGLVLPLVQRVMAKAAGATSSGAAQKVPTQRANFIDDLRILDKEPAANARRGPAQSTDRPSPVRTPPVQWSAEVFEQIEWRRFEAVIEALFAQAGFETRSQSHGADGGVDIWLHSRHQPGAPVSLVQCKHWSGKRVGVDKVRELKGVMASRGVKRGQFATTSTFTPDAIEFAKANGIALLDANSILELISKRTPQEQQALLTAATEGEYWKPTCGSCGIKLTERQPRNGGKAFWGCPNYPKCKGKLPMRLGA